MSKKHKVLSVKSWNPQTLASAVCAMEQGEVEVNRAQVLDVLHKTALLVGLDDGACEALCQWGRKVALKKAVE